MEQRRAVEMGMGTAARGGLEDGSDDTRARWSQ
jgi:hypothetical protein